jgi:serine/threonine-protein kinase
VLPFVNMSPDRENEYFGDGLAEEILNLLTKIPGLKVIARTSSFAFRGKEQDIRKIAETLGVSNILEGSVRRAGNRLRIAAQLIQASDGAHLWSERYDRDLTDVFAIQDEIGQAISEALKVRLAPPVKTANIEAWRFCLQGEFYRQRYTPEDLRKGKECLEQALKIDPNYAPAYDGLAGYYHALALLDMAPAKEVFPLARTAAEKALALDSANIASHTRLGVIAAASEYDWEAAGHHHRKAMSAQAIPTNSRFLYAVYYLAPLGRAAEAVEQCRSGLEIDPLSTFLHVGMDVALIGAKQYGDAIACTRRGLEIDPNFYFLWTMLGEVQLATGNYKDAVVSLNRSTELAPWFSFGLGMLAAACYQVGNKELSQDCAQRLSHLHNGGSIGLAYYHAATGNADAMFQALDRAYTRREIYLLWINSWKYFDPYRSDPRFHNLLRRMNLAVTSATAV